MFDFFCFHIIFEKFIYILQVGAYPLFALLHNSMVWVYDNFLYFPLVCIFIVSTLELVKLCTLSSAYILRNAITSSQGLCTLMHRWYKEKSLTFCDDHREFFIPQPCQHVGLSAFFILTTMVHVCFYHIVVLIGISLMTNKYESIFIYL